MDVHKTEENTGGNLPQLPMSFLPPGTRVFGGSDLTVKGKAEGKARGNVFFSICKGGAVRRKGSDT